MFQKIIKAITGAAVALALLAPTPLMAQDETVVEDTILYDTPADENEVLEQTQDEDSIIYETQDYDWETLLDDYETTSAQDLTEEEAAALGLAAILTGTMLLVFGVFSIVMYIYYAWALMVIAKKVKEEPTWFAWVPFLNLYLMAKIAKVNPISILLILIPVVNLVYGVFLMMKVAERRGFPNWLGLLILIPVANMILPGYLAWAEPSKAN